MYYTENENGERLPCAKIRVNNNPRIRVFTGGTLELSNNQKLLIAGFDVPKTKQETGKVYLKKME